MKFLNTKMVIFDLDGTLVDSVPDLARGVDRMMEKMGQEPPGEEKVRCWVGNGVERLVRRALTDALEANPEEVLFERALLIFLKQYTKNNGKHSRLFPGVRDTLVWLRAREIIVVCVTNKADRFTVPLLKALNIDHLFGLVISGDTLAKKKPDPMPLLYCAKHFSTEPANILMVGDSVNDVKAARAAGFPVVAVSYGYNYGQDIHIAAPDLVIDNFDKLQSLLV